MVDEHEVLSHARACFGSRCELESLERFVGGVRKQTFYVQLGRPSIRCLFIVWRSDASYFVEREVAGFERSQSDAVAPHAFRRHTEYLTELGLNVARILHFGQLESGHHFAFVERIDGPDYGMFRAVATPADREVVLESLAGQVRQLHAVERAYPGGVLDDRADVRASPLDESFDVALVELRAAAETEPWVAEHHDRILRALGELRAAVRPRETFNLLHGELDPSHILVRSEDHVVYLVDIEGIGFGDLESEHAFLIWRFSEEDYRRLARDDLDQGRLAYYKLRMHVSLIYAGSRLLMREHPAKELAHQILSRNLTELQMVLELDTETPS